MPVDEFAEFLSVPVTGDRSYHTVAGLVLKHFGVLPQVGDWFELDRWRIEVVDIDGRRIDKILATKIDSGVRQA